MGQADRIRTMPGGATVLDLFERFIPRGAIVLSILTFGGYVMGLVRDRILTREYGAGIELDAWNAAFVIPELTLGVVVASGLAAPFIPLYTGLRRDDEGAAHRFGQTILTGAVLAMAVAVVILLIVAPLTADLVVPGFDAAQRALYVDLFRIMCVTPLIFAGSIALGEVLVAERRFVFYGLAPLLYNLGIVLGTLALAPAIGIHAAAVGAVLGALLHLGIRLAGTFRTTFRARPRWEIRTLAVRDFVRLMLPKTLSSPVEPLTFLFFTRVASTLVEGTITTVNLARNFQSVPVSLIGVAFSVAAFPGFASAYAAGDRPGFIRVVRSQGITIGVLTTLAGIGLAIVGPTAIDRLFGGGRFDADDVARTSIVLAVFAISVPFESLGHLVSRAIYATRHTLLQVVATLIGFAVTVGVTLATTEPWGAVAIPAGFTAGAATRLVLLVAVLIGRIRSMPTTPTHLVGDVPVDEGAGATPAAA